jgi:acetyltransferase
VEKRDEKSGDREIIGVGRLTKIGNGKAEFAIVVSDQYQRQGLGVELLSRLVQIGRDEKLRQIRAEILPENRAMQRVSEKVGFRLKSKADGSLIGAELNL